MKTDAATSIPNQISEPRGTAGSSHAESSADQGSDRQADEVLETVRELLAIGRLTTARGLVERTLRRFPDHAELGKLSRFLDLEEAKSNPVVEPSTKDEIDWLADPPECARGRWVGPDRQTGRRHG